MRIKIVTKLTVRVCLLKLRSAPPNHSFKKMDAENKTPKKVNPRESINSVFASFYVHLFPVFKKSYKKGFKEEDLYQPLEEHKSNILADKLESIWLTKKTTQTKYGLHQALLKLFGFNLFFIGIIKLIVEVLYVIVMPYAVGGLVRYFEQGPSKIENNEGYIYAALIIASLAVFSFQYHTSLMAMMHLSMKLRVACCSLIYRKSLRLSQSSLAQTTIGHIITLLSNDVSKFDTGFILFHYTWTSPIQAVVGTYMLYRCIGVSAFAGIIFLLLFVPLQVYFGKRTSQIRLRTVSRTDERVRLMDEILCGIQAIKMYTWEKPFTKLIAEARRLEVNSIRIRSFIEATMFALEMFLTRASIFISFVVFIYLGNFISADAAYTVTAVYGVIRPGITMLFSYSIAYIGEVFVTIRRLSDFLMLEELAPVNTSVVPNGTTITEETQLLDKTEVELNEANTLSAKIILKNVSAKWFTDSAANTLSNIHLSITYSQLVAIIGPVGSGKSSILNVILKELSINNGNMETNGIISYACQEAWLFSGSIRQNILFGAQYEEARYKSVIKACALESDLRILPNGDQTTVGEKGSLLSGGQRARINLARCIYKRADIYLLDDPLSAVDTKVGRRLYDECITKFLHNKICILVTHQLQYLKNASKIIILKKGEIIGNGTYKELQSSGLDFVKLLQEFSAPDEEEAEKRKMRSRQSSELSLDRYEYFEPPTNINKETFETGKIKAATYISYFRAGGSYLVMILLAFAFIAAQGAGNAGDYTVAYWVNLEQEGNSDNGLSNSTLIEDRTKLIYTYSGITIATIILAIGRSIFFYSFFMRASINMHNSIFAKISYATMRFFNINPIGRILNRFSKDIGIIDEYIPFLLIDIPHNALLLVGAITLTTLVNPWLLLPTAGLFVIFYFLRLVYIETSRTVKRIEGITRSPMFNHITATMDGLSTIRAFSAQNILAKEFDAHQDHHSSAWYLFISCSRAFGFWIDMICTVFISFVTIFVAMMDRDLYKGGDVGLILTQCLNLSNMLQWGMRQWSELENSMTSVERVLEYTKVETEPVRDASVAIPENWPEFGKIIFKHLSMKYDPNELPVLKDIDVTINEGEKIGVVGRTGAGKSSTIVALFQLFPVEGSIIIDDVDTTKIPLDRLRSKISIIPQAPVLFSGTMRKNLDPFEEFGDEVLWSALEEVEMKDVITELSSPVTESGTNFSIGQRQLICLARAIIRNNKILLMDEATANVDPHTDALIQKTIRKKFAQCTVITVAHRLHTVMDSDRILVMDAGRVIEFDHPHNLLQHTDSIFYSMVQTTGGSAALKLKTVAEESYLKLK